MSTVDPERSAPPLIPLRRTLQDVRAAAALAEARPAYAAGLRAALATAAPLLVDHILHTGGGTWMALAGFSGALADKGGPYQTRATTLAALTVGGALAAALGTLIGGHPAAAIPATFLVGVVASLARAYGNAGASVGVSVLNIYIISLGYPPSARGTELDRAGFVVIGGLWAMLVALVLWPLRPYRPVRQAVAAAYGGELNQVWANLIDNALDAVNEGGRVAVAARAEGGRVVVRVTDDGAGIPAEVKSRIFDPFFTTKPIGKGTGLGLDIVRRLVDRNDGSIEVESEPGRTEFRVALPVLE